MTRPDMKGRKNWNWKGTEASYYAKHIWASNNFGHPMGCEECRQSFDSTYKIHWANVSGKFKRVRSDWRRLCVSCHRKFDYRRGAYHLRGAKHQWAKLTEKDVLDIRAQFVPRKHRGVINLAAKYKVSPSTIQMVVRRLNWKHL